LRNLHALALVVGLATGAVLAVACGTPSHTCPSSCTGCCDTTGTCQLGTMNTACGSSAQLCISCQPSTHCSVGLCVPDGTGGSTGGGTGGGSTGGGTGGGATGGGTGGGATGGGTGGGATGGGAGGGTTQHTITEVANGSLTEGQCVEVRGVAMSPPFSDNDDTYTPDGGVKLNRQGFYVSEKNLTTTVPFSGVEVVLDIGQTTPSVVPGDDVDLIGIVHTNFGHQTLRLVAGCSQVSKLGTAATPAPAQVTLAGIGQSGGSTGCPVTGAPWVDGADARGYDGTLARFTNGTVSAPRDTFGLFEVSDGLAPLSKLQVANTLGLTLAPNLGDSVSSITGFGHFSFCRRKIRPRTDADVSLVPVVTTCGSGGRADHLLISEISVTPTAGEYVEIFNPTAAVIDLTNVYVYNATFNAADGGLGCKYFLQPSGAACGDAFGDFNLRFPPGALIGPSELQTIAVTGAVNYCFTYGCATAAAKPTYEIAPPTGDDFTVPNMGGAWDPNPANFPDAGFQGGYGFLTNASEDLVLYSWDGTSSTVRDIDYVVWGASLGVRTDKTGIAGYTADTPVASQLPAPGAPAVTQSIQRVCLNEGAETRGGGNGVTGHNETSENLTNDFVLRDKTPKAQTVGAVP